MLFITGASYLTPPFCRCRSSHDLGVFLRLFYSRNTTRARAPGGGRGRLRLNAGGVQGCLETSLWKAARYAEGKTRPSKRAPLVANAGGRRPLRKSPGRCLPSGCHQIASLPAAPAILLPYICARASSASSCFSTV
jgi:hypothetical protein